MWNDPIRVCQLPVVVVGKYSLVYQNVQSSVGSTVRFAVIAPATQSDADKKERVLGSTPRPNSWDLALALTGLADR